MLLAAIGRIQGNLPALKAVLDEIDEQGIEVILNTGDCAAGHRWPNEVISVLRERAILTVQGEMDRHVTRFARKRERIRANVAEETFEVLERAYENTWSEHIEYLRSLPRTMCETIDGVVIYLCYGVGKIQSDGLREGDETVRFRRLRELAGADLIVCGRTHGRFERTVDGALFVNPGSVGGVTEEEALAWYAVIDTETEPWQVDFHCVAYGA